MTGRCSATEVGAVRAGSGSGRGGPGGLGGGEVEGGGSDVEGGDGEVEGGPRGGGGEAGRPRAAAVRMSATSTPAGDDDEVGATAKWGRRRRSGARDRFGGEVVAGGKPFLVKSKVTVARYRKRAISKLAIARFRERASATSSSFFPFFIHFSLHYIFFLSPFSISFIFIYFSILFHFILFSLAVAIYA